MSATCPFCDYSGRMDNVKRHIQNCHHLAGVANILLDNGNTFRPAPRKPYVVVSLTDDGSAKSGGYCFRCGDIIPHVKGASIAMYSGHPCKTVKGKPLPIPDTSFLDPPAPVIVAPSLPPQTLTGMDWPGVLRDLETDPVAKKVLDAKRIKETYIETDDSDDDTVVKEERGPREIILEAVKCSALLKQCARLEKEKSYFQGLVESQDTEVYDLRQKLIDAEQKLYNLSQDMSERLMKAEQRIKELTPTVDTIEHAA
jgi:hypothetical protein